MRNGVAKVIPGVARGPRMIWGLASRQWRECLTDRCKEHHRLNKSPSRFQIPVA